jgi:hypothetical protein
MFDSDISLVDGVERTKSARPVMTIFSISCITVSRALSTVGACALTKSSDSNGNASTSSVSSLSVVAGCSRTSDRQRKHHKERGRDIPSSATLSAAFANSRSFSPSPDPLSASLTRFICTSSLLATSTNRDALLVRSEACARTCSRRTRTASCSCGICIF